MGIRFGVRIGAVLAVAALPIAGCSSPSPLKVPEQDGIRVEANEVVWSTDEPTLGAVRYGATRGEYDRVAYPPARFRLDKALTREHRVPLIAPADGETVYLQVLDRAEDGRISASEELEVRISGREPPGPVLEWTMIDVGFGDSHLLTMPNTGTRVLVDAGERRDWPNVDRYLTAEGVDRIDVVLGTHIHADHIGGLVGESWTLEDGVLGAYDIGVYLDTPTRSASRYAYTELLNTLDARGIPVSVVSAGETDDTSADLDWDPAVGVEVLNSGHGRSIGGSKEGDYLNNDSIVLRLTYGDVSLMLGGDAEAPVQVKMVQERGTDLESEVLKVHHHGLDDSSESGYLDAVDPRVGVIPITTYESSNGTLPSGVVLRRLQERGVDVYASDRAEPLDIRYYADEGHNVTVRTDGRSYEVLVRPSQSRHYLPD